jgi:hypothetical protein
MNATAQTMEQTPTIDMSLTMSLLGLSVVVSIIFVVGFLKFIKKG